jgi:hypothetical protein
MDDQPTRPVPQSITDVLERSVCDIAEGNLLDARAIQIEARRMLADYERAHRAALPSSKTRPAKRTRSA